MALLKLSAPWQIFYKELDVMFKKDSEVHIVCDPDNYTIDMYVENEAKAEALGKILPISKNFGNIDVTINVIPANKCNARRSKGSLIEDAFYDNPVVDKIVTLDGIMSNPITFVIFTKEVVQYWNDNLFDANGVCSTLYQEIAKNIFEDIDGVYFCTNTETGWTYTYSANIGSAITTNGLTVKC